MNAYIRGLIFEAMGEVSMCWSEQPKGVFDSEEAKRIAERLIKDIENMQFDIHVPTLPVQVGSTISGGTIRIDIKDGVMVNIKEVSQ